MSSVYQVRRGTLYHGDACEIMRTLPDASIGTIVTSPPYNLRNSTGNGLKGQWDSSGSNWWASPALEEGYDGHDDAMPLDEYIDWQRACIGEMLRLLKPEGALFYNHKWRVQAGLYQRTADLITEGFPVRQIIIWARDGGMAVNPRHYFTPSYEVLYLIADPDFRFAEGGTAGMTDVWRIPHERGNPHPAPFPEALPERCIRAVQCGPILDPFVGSGTTAVVAERLGYEWIGIDQSAAYIEMARERMSCIQGLLA